MSVTSAPSAAAFDLDDYREKGFAVLRGLFQPEEMAAVADEAAGLIERHGELIDTNNIRCRFQPHVGTGECLFETFDPVNDLSPACRRIAEDPRILGILEQIYGETPRLFKDKLIFKPPGARGYGLHQDFIAWPGFPRSFLTVLVPIDACDPENGSTELYPGYHHNGLLTPEDGEYHELPEGTVDPATVVKLTLEPGDVAVFGGFVPHGSAPNRSDRWRRQLYLSYNADSDGGDRRDAHYAEFHAWLRKKYAEYGKPDVYFR